MRNFFPWYLIFIFIITYSCSDNKTKPSHPNIFLVKGDSENFKSLNELKKPFDDKIQKKMWEDLKSNAENDLKLPYLDPSINFKGRSPVHLKHKNLSYDMSEGVTERLSRLALMFLMTKENKYKQAVLSQIVALNDTKLWPMWCDDAHMKKPPHVDIRTFRISMWVALCFNWMYDHLSFKERKFIVEVLDKRAIKPFIEKLAQKPFWYKNRHNWFTNIFGGMGITAMALGDHHPKSQFLIDIILPEMKDFNNIFGKMGEFNEPPGYSGAIRYTVEFFEAYRYYTNNRINLLNQKPFPEVCYWMLNHFLPPGRTMAFGDTSPDKMLKRKEIFAAVANANNDGILQHFYKNNFEKLNSTFEFLWYNPKVIELNPKGQLPLGIEYKEWGQDLISRTSWDYKTAKCIVYGKSGREANHDDNDVGQLLIDGFGERLIIDPGKPEPIYPKDYFGKFQYNYYTRSTKGHNVLVIDNHEMISEPNQIARGKTLRTFFNDMTGSAWEIDLTPVYKNVKNANRKVIHFFPGLVLVHDEVKLEKEGSIDLRWHCISKPKLTTENSFIVRNKKAMISAKIIALDNSKINLSTGSHKFKSPYNLTRQGDTLIQKNEPFVKISTKNDSFSVLSIFVIKKNNSEIPEWSLSKNNWEITYNNVTYVIKMINEKLVINSSENQQRKLEF